MTNKQKIMKMCLFSLCLTLGAICFIMIWYKDTDLWEFTWFFLGLIFWALCVPALKYPKIDYKKINKLIDESIRANPIPLDKVNEMFRFYGLENIELKILKVFFNKDYTKRCVFCQQSNGVSVRFEDLRYYSDDTKHYTLRFAGWDYSYNDKAMGLYADSDIAYREAREALKDFKEEKIAVDLKHVYSAKIIWKKWKIGSKEIPFGERLSFDIKRKNTEFKNVKIENNTWFSEFYCRVSAYVDAKYEPVNLKNSKFGLYKNGEKVGTIIFEK